MFLCKFGYAGSLGKRFSTTLPTPIHHRHSWYEKIMTGHDVMNQTYLKLFILNSTRLEVVGLSWNVALN